MCTFYLSDNMPAEICSLACVGVLFLRLFCYKFNSFFELEHICPNAFPSVLMMGSFPNFQYHFLMGVHMI
jgi:hypothetical protein